MVFHESSGKEINEIISRNTTKIDMNVTLLHMPYTSEYEKCNPEHVLLTNGFIQVMVGCSLYYKYVNSSQTSGDSIQFFFSNSISKIEFFSSPLVHQLMSVFKSVKPVGFENNISGLWVNEPFQNTVEAYKNLLSLGKIDPCMAELFKAKGHSLLGADIGESNKIYEIKQEAFDVTKEDLERRVIKNKFLMYFLTNSMGNQNMSAFLLHGWTQEEICNCEYINDLKCIFDRVFVLGSGEPWLSTQVIVINPINNLNIESLFSSSITKQFEIY